MRTPIHKDTGQTELVIPRTVHRPSPAIIEAEIPEGLHREVVAMARKAGQPVEAIMRQAVREFIAEQ